MCSGRRQDFFHFNGKLVFEENEPIPRRFPPRSKLVVVLTHKSDDGTELSKKVELDVSRFGYSTRLPRWMRKVMKYKMKLPAHVLTPFINSEDEDGYLHVEGTLTLGKTRGEEAEYHYTTGPTPIDLVKDRKRYDNVLVLRRTAN